MLKDKDLLCESDLFKELNQEEIENISGGATRLVRSVDFFGGDIRLIRNSSLSSCRRAVDNNRRAIFGTYNLGNRNCFLKGLGVRPLFNRIAVGIIHVNP